MDARILDCAAGPSSFNGEMTRLGYRVVSTDPLYRLSAESISRRIDETRKAMLAGLKKARDRFIWNHYGTPEAVEAVRVAAARDFLDDFGRGAVEGRYVAAALPHLPFANDTFDLVLCSHFLFLYSAKLDADFHVAGLREMLRVGREARVFPLLDLEGEPSRHVAPVRTKLASHSLEGTIVRVSYEFQKGGDAMLRVRRSQ